MHQNHHSDHLEQSRRQTQTEEGQVNLKTMKLQETGSVIMMRKIFILSGLCDHQKMKLHHMSEMKACTNQRRKKV
jgi:hypothetical protein